MARINRLDPGPTAPTSTKKRRTRKAPPPPPPPPVASRPRSVERPGSSSQVRNPNSLRSYPFLRANAGVNWRSVEPLLLQKLNTLGRQTGNIITLTSGFRTYAEQRRLYAAHLRGEIEVAAPPGQSNHEGGNAVDAVVNGSPIATALGEGALNAVGLRSLAHINDPVHVELSSGGGSGAATPAPSVMAPTPSVAPSTPSVEYAPAPNAPAPTEEFVPPMQETVLPFEIGLDTQVQGMTPQQRAETWQIIAQQPGASPEAQTLARIARISTGG